MASNNKTVLITGATRGIGLELATHYTKSGWNVIAAARNVNKADKLKALAPYKIVQLDASNEDSILQAAKSLEGEAIELLINNAGIGGYDTVETATKASIMEQFEVNAVGPFLVTRAFLPHLRAATAKSGSATVGQISSIMGCISDEQAMATPMGFYGYRASKTALNMINASLALELKKDKIVTVSLHPGHVSTDMTSGYVSADTTNDNGPISPEKSVAGLSKVLASVTEADTGKFIRFDGVRLPW